MQPSTVVFIRRPVRGLDGKVDNASARNTILKFANYIKGGMIGGICPEGTRNKNWKETPILPLKKGFLFAWDEIKTDLVIML